MQGLWVGLSTEGAHLCREQALEQENVRFCGGHAACVRCAAAKWPPAIVPAPVARSHRTWSVDHVVHPSARLLHPQVTPFRLRQKMALRRAHMTGRFRAKHNKPTWCTQAHLRHMHGNVRRENHVASVGKAPQPQRGVSAGRSRNARALCRFPQRHGNPTPAPRDGAPCSKAPSARHKRARIGQSRPRQPPHATHRYSYVSSRYRGEYMMSDAGIGANRAQGAKTLAV